MGKEGGKYIQETELFSLLFYPEYLLLQRLLPTYILYINYIFFKDFVWQSLDFNTLFF